MQRARAIAIWAILLGSAVLAASAAAFSPLLAWREPIYIIAGFAGIAGLALMVFQPLLAAGQLPGISLASGRRIHRVVGATLVFAVVLHVLGLWVTSPPDVVDVLLFRSPAPFSLWGAVAMWAVFLAAAVAVFRHRMRLKLWRWVHTTLVVIAVATTVAHAIMIEGTMEPLTRALLSVVALLALAKAVLTLGVWRSRTRRGVRS